ncbi:MAG: acyl-CoA thioesterase [Proteobacteria bacterium]|nr:acyl-CoA thioesterase [Pseudomonadota bacterium]MBU1739148.1 acyl-CoA thioesterase [Pseudomonadota bacterium]
MGFARAYFTVDPAAPSALTARATRRVRFEEVDMLRIVWHGNYVSYLDDGRVAFGDRYPALSYGKMREEKTAAPIVRIHLDYQSPLHFDEEMEIITTLHWSDALRFNFEYRINGADGRLAARGYTVQLLTDLSGTTILLPPDWIAAFRREWQSGVFG